MSIARGYFLVMAALVIISLSLGWVIHDYRLRFLRKQTEQSTIHVLGTIAAELSAGATPAAALAAGAAEPSDEQLRMTLELAASRAAMDINQGIKELADSQNPALITLATAWTLSLHHGIALTEITARIRKMLEDRHQSAERAHAAMQGPVLSGWMLAFLPVIGVAMGGAMGINTLAFYVSNSLGQLVFFLGITAQALGIFFTHRIMTGGAE
ncbi:type II secretion system F family protein [Corynebacterium sp. ES2794-CONJ1]|uniref:type II secretion system F family protein n=1 Tax=unclassified Corynebacterium TaxID=2624378 RepID=UPI002168F99F|nr:MULTISPECIES: type II secretion system F family protein [unclassified Corynebacterium]MCS4492087.1 type II secretion system F family protein [Corynebacterium sp. ES2715-CONJ3]MCU9519591.1 type II secretion system F family protein [Corynebacterium sp. ES2794-CONJ1]